MHLWLQPKDRVPLHKVTSLLDPILHLSVPPVVIIAAPDLLLHVLVHAHHLIVVKLHLVLQLLFHHSLLLHVEVNLVLGQFGVEVFHVGNDLVVELLKDLDELIMLVFHAVQIDLVSGLLREVEVLSVVPWRVQDLGSITLV